MGRKTVDLTGMWFGKLTVSGRAGNCRWATWEQQNNNKIAWGAAKYRGDYLLRQN